jgi:hypothetical protein
MSSIVQLKRSALTGKVPGTGSLNLGELALNTYDGKIFFRRSGSTDTIQEVVTTNVVNTGSITITGTLTAESIVGSISASNGVVSGSSQVIEILSSLNSHTSSINNWSSSLATTGSNQFKADQNITGSLRATGTGSFGSLKVNDTLTINHGETIISGSALVTNDLIILGAVNARQFNISIISSSVLFESGSSKFGNTSDDIHSFTGSVQISGSQNINGGINITGSIIPGVTNTYDLGSDTNQFRHLYISSGSIYMDGTKVFGSETILPSIGEYLEGGIVFHIADDQSYVLIGDQNDLTGSTGNNLFYSFEFSSNSTGSGIGDGLLNTNQSYLNNPAQTNTPIQLAYSSTRYGYSDWYLPSNEELQTLAENTDILGGVYGNNRYWSSTVWNNNNHYQVNANSNDIISPAQFQQGYDVAFARAIRKSTTRKTTLQTLTNQNISGSISVTGAVTASSFVSNDSSKFGNTSDDIHSFTGSVEVSGSVTATSFVGNGSGLTGLVVDLGSAQLNDVDGNNIPARSFAELFVACAVAEIVDLDFGI